MLERYKGGRKKTGRPQAAGKPCTKTVQCSFDSNGLAGKTNCIPRDFSLIPISASRGLMRLITCHLEPATSDACVV